MIYRSTKKTYSQQHGFVLVEMLVALFMFSIVMFVSLGAVLTLVDANKKNQSSKSVINNLTLVVNGIVKNIAVSGKYYCGTADLLYPGLTPTAYTGEEADCPDGVPSDSITFLFNEDTNNNGAMDVIRYKYEETDPVNHTGRIVRSIDSITNYVPITAPEVKVTQLQFFVHDTDPLIIYPDESTSGTIEQPRVMVYIKGYAGKKDQTKTEFNIQTTVSQRTLDVIYE